MLLSQGSSRDLQDGDIVNIIESGNLKGLKLLLDRNPQLLSDVTDAEFSPFFTACKAVKIDIAVEILKRGGDPNFRDKQGKTGFFVLCKRDYLNEAEALLDPAFGVDVNIADKEGSTPLQLAAYNNQEKWALKLIRHGASLNLADEFSRTPLHHACREVNEEMVRLLIAHGADPTLRDGDDNLPHMEDRIMKAIIEESLEGRNDPEAYLLIRRNTMRKSFIRSTSITNEHLGLETEEDNLGLKL